MTFYIGQKVEVINGERAMGIPSLAFPLMPGTITTVIKVEGPWVSVDGDPERRMWDSDRFRPAETAGK